MYTETEILAKQALSRTLKLSGAFLLDDTAAVQRDCNGIGAAWFPDRWRDLIDGAFPELEIVADIHDRRNICRPRRPDRAPGARSGARKIRGTVAV